MLLGHQRQVILHEVIVRLGVKAKKIGNPCDKKSYLVNKVHTKSLLLQKILWLLCDEIFGVSCIFRYRESVFGFILQFLRASH